VLNCGLSDIFGQARHNSRSDPKSLPNSGPDPLGSPGWSLWNLEGLPGSAEFKVVFVFVCILAFTTFIPLALLCYITLRLVYYLEMRLKKNN
jgi:hypothetical protein